MKTTMTRTLSPLTLALALVACHGPIPEGRYPCMMDRDCPPAWYCHAEGLCWSTPETTVDAGADAFVPTDATSASDTNAPDTGPTCGAETCNGADDDCDGLIDEGVMTVGPAVTATTTDGIPVAMVAESGGFGIMSSTASTPSDPIWVRIDQSGTPIVASPSLGSDVQIDAPWTVDVAEGAGQVLATTVDSTADRRYLFGFDPSSGTRIAGSTPFEIPLASGSSPTARAVFVAAAGGRATLFVGTTQGSVGAIYRYRLDVSSDPPRVIDSRQVVNDLQGGLDAWTAIATASAEYVAYRRNTTEMVLSAGPSGDTVGAFHVVGVIAPASHAGAMYVAMAIADPTATVSPTNPLGIAWTGRVTTGASGPATFVQVTDTTVLAATPPAAFPDSMGALGSFFILHAIALAPLGDAPGHWILVNQDSDAAHTSSALQVRELVDGAATVRRIAVPGGTSGARTDVAVVRSGASIRLVDHADGGGFVTRSIGCE